MSAPLASNSFSKASKFHPKDTRAPDRAGSKSYQVLQSRVRWFTARVRNVFIWKKEPFSLLIDCAPYSKNRAIRLRAGDEAETPGTWSWLASLFGGTLRRMDDCGDGATAAARTDKKLREQVRHEISNIVLKYSSGEVEIGHRPSFDSTTSVTPV